MQHQRRKCRSQTQMENKLYSLKKTARLAGLLDLFWILSGLFALVYLPSKINTRGDAVTAAQNILSNEFLFRIGIINGLFSCALWIFLIMLFYRIFKSVDLWLAQLLVALVIVQVPIGLIMEAFNITTLMILKGEILKTVDLGQRQEFALLFIRINEYILWVLELFWGLWLFPLGILIYKSLFLPRFLGVWLIINGIAYVVLSITTILLPQYKDILFKISFPAMLGELVFMLWLLIMGVKCKLPILRNDNKLT
jgi:hypothetical protein